MKERILTLLLLLLALLTLWALLADLQVKSASEESLQPVSASAPLVSGEVIRLHILANSDSDYDQSVKLYLRDLLLPYLNAATLTASSKTEALTQLSVQCDFLTKTANDALSSLGVPYTATVSVKSIYFPLRIYGSETYLSPDAVLFPPGIYDSVQVVLGNGTGHNWWCLAYPSLCFIDASYDYIPKDSDLYKKELCTVSKSALFHLFYGSSSFAGLPPELLRSDAEETITIQFGSKLWELINSLFQNSPNYDKIEENNP